MSSIVFQYSDKDECAISSDNECTQKDKCVNTAGGYTCSCASGYKLLTDGRTCTGIFVVIFYFECVSFLICFP